MAGPVPPDMQLDKWPQHYGVLQPDQVTPLPEVVAGRLEAAEAAAVADLDSAPGGVVGDVERAPERLRVSDAGEVLAWDAALVGTALVGGDQLPLAAFLVLELALTAS